MMTNGGRILVLASAVLLLAACGNKNDDAAPKTQAPPILTAATLGEQTILNPSDYRAQAQYANADIENGASRAQICKACHSLDSAGGHMIGPALYGFFGRGAGTLEGFAYSAAVSNADFVWTPRALDGWLRQPGLFLPGNSMTFAGVMRQNDRDDLIAYLLNETAKGPTGK